LLRAKKNGLRNIKSIINEKYINEIYFTLSSKEIIKIFEKKNYLLYSSFPNIISIDEILNPKISFSKFNIKFKNYKLSNKFILNDLFFIKSQDRIYSMADKKFLLILEKNILKFTNLFNKQNKKKEINKNIVLKKIKIIKKK